MTIPNSILNHKNIELSGINLSSGILKTLKDIGKDAEIIIYDEEGDILISWLFTSKALKSSGSNITDVNLLYTSDDIAPETGIYNLVGGKSKKGLTLKLSHTGPFPAQASIKLYVGDRVEFKSGSKIYLYHYNKTTNKLETLPYSSKYKVDKEGYVTINLLHGGEFVVLSKAADNKTITSLVKQLKLSPNKTTLYVKDTKGNKAKTKQLKITLPLSLEIVENIKAKTSQDAIGGVSVTYRSGNSKIAKVSKSGKITAVKRELPIYTRS